MGGGPSTSGTEVIFSFPSFLSFQLFSRPLISIVLCFPLRIPSKNLCTTVTARHKSCQTMVAMVMNPARSSATAGHRRYLRALNGGCSCRTSCRRGTRACSSSRRSCSSPRYTRARYYPRPSTRWSVPARPSVWPPPSAATSTVPTGCRLPASPSVCIPTTLLLLLLPHGTNNLLFLQGFNLQRALWCFWQSVIPQIYMFLYRLFTD